MPGIAQVEARGRLLHHCLRMRQSRARAHFPFRKRRERVSESEIERWVDKRLAVKEESGSEKRVRKTTGIRRAKKRARGKKFWREEG
jgi:hypothetical protein